MPSKAEQHCSRALRAILADLPDGASFADLETAEYREFLSGLEWFLPGVLGEIHSEWSEQAWDAEALDGVLPLFARKMADREAEILGVGILISDQATTPLHVRLQIAPVEDEITWLECRLGERGSQGMLRTPYDPAKIFPKRLYVLNGDLSQLDWFYHVTFGERAL
jgi:hypothetical protein